MEKTTDEKIDYIYNNIKSEKRKWLFHLIIKIIIYWTIIGYCIYFYYWGFEKMKQDFVESIKPNINSEEVIDWLKKKSWDVIDKIKNIF